RCASTPYNLAGSSDFSRLPDGRGDLSRPYGLFLIKRQAGKANRGLGGGIKGAVIFEQLALRGIHQVQERIHRRETADTPAISVLGDLAKKVCVIDLL